MHQCLSTLHGRKTRDRGATPYFKTASAYQGRSTLHGRRTRDRGAAPYFIPALASQSSSAPCRQRSRDRGASPYFITAIQVRVWGGLPLFQTTTPSIGSSPRRANDRGRGASPFVTALPGEPDVEAAGRCHYPGAVSTVTAGAGPYLRPSADSPLFHRLPIPVPSDRTRSPPHDVPVHTQGTVGWGRGAHKSPGEGWVPGGPGLLLHTATPRVEPALCHRGSRCSLGKWL